MTHSHTGWRRAVAVHRQRMVIRAACDYLNLANWE